MTDLTIGTVPEARTPHKRGFRAPLFAFMAAALALTCLSGCAESSASANPSPKAAPAAAGPSNTEYLQGALTCTVLSTMYTNVENARSAHDQGKLSDAADAAIINTVPSTLQILRSDKNAGLTDNVRFLAVDATLTAPKVPGATFDPDSAPYATSMQKAMSACKQNGTPIGILAPAGQG